MIFEDQEQAENAYIKLLEGYMNNMVGYQLVTAQLIGCLRGMVEASDENKKAGIKPTEAEKIERSLLLVVIKERQAEIKEMGKVLMLPEVELGGINVNEEMFESLIQENMNSAASRARHHVDKTGTKEKVANFLKGLSGEAE